jgi:hypothetical protein
MVPSILQFRCLDPTCIELSVDGGTAYSVTQSLNNNNQRSRDVSVLQGLVSVRVAQ